ncbi:MAG: transcriptional repressor NrdR [Anaerolineae bacterium]|nr:transcriptional repressor NrdR [Anaerolineae bacterium]
MQCPYCGGTKLKVLDTTDIKNGIRRRRECQVCGERFTTYERALAVIPVLIKENGNREEFDREKLKRGIWNACAKRPIPAAEIDKLAMRVEAYLQSLGRSEVSSRVVGDMVIEGLKNLDPIAYIRYAIVYLGLDNLLSVRSEIDKLLAEQQAIANGTPQAVEAPPDGLPAVSDNDISSVQEPASDVDELSGRLRRTRDEAKELSSLRSVTPTKL